MGIEKLGAKFNVSFLLGFYEKYKFVKTKKASLLKLYHEIQDKAAIDKNCTFAAFPPLYGIN